MKKKTQKRITISMLSVLLVSGVAGGVATQMQHVQSNSTSTKQKQIPSNQKVSVEAQKDILSKLEKAGTSGFYPSEFEESLKQALPKLDKKYATKAVRAFMNNIELTSDYYTELLYFMNPEIEHAKALDGIDDPVKDSKKITNKFAKGFLDEAKTQHLVLNPTGDLLYIESDANYVLEKYGSYVQGDYKDYLNLLAKEQTDPIFDTKTQTYKLKRLKEDLHYIENSRSIWEKGAFADDFKELEEKLYGLFFSKTQGTFFDSKVVNEGKENEDITYTLKDEAKKDYEAFIQEDKDNPLSKDIESYLKVLKKNKYQITDEVDQYMEKLFTEKFEA